MFDVKFLLAPQTILLLDILINNGFLGYLDSSSNCKNPCYIEDAHHLNIAVYMVGRAANLG